MLEDIERLVKIDVAIDQEYKPEYDDTNSEEYAKFVGDFKMRMDTFYRGQLPNFDKVVVNTVSRVASRVLVRRSASGVAQSRLAADARTARKDMPNPQGVNVDHDVVLLVPNDASSEQQYQAEVTDLKEALATLADSSCITDCPYNLTQPPSVETTAVNLETLCSSLIKDPDLARHYRAVNNTVNNTLECVTPCQPLYGDGMVKCWHGGKCKVFRDVGAVCLCKDLSTTWYLGKHCSNPIQTTAFYAGLSVTLACLLATVAGLTAYMIINKKEQRRKKDMKKKMVNNWLNDEVEWSRSGKLSTGTFNAGHLNPSFSYDEPPPRQPTPTRQHADSRQSGRPSQGLSMYRLDGAAYRNNVVPPHDGFSPSDQAMRINRPQIRTSWDA
ncbi:mucin-3A [Festucalex cinctus]